MRKDFEISINRGRELLGIPEDILADIQAIGAIAGTMSGDGEPWVPGLVLILNGEHPITVLREIWV